MVLDVGFQKGAPEGLLKLFGPHENDGPLLEATFSDGRLDGTMKVYEWTSHKLIHTFSWDKGVASGAEEAFDVNTGAVVKRATFANGQYEGEVVRYAPDGKQVTIKATYTNGKLNGPYEEWDTAGQLIVEKTYNNGVEVGADGSSVDDCVRSWEEAEAKIQEYALREKGLNDGYRVALPQAKREELRPTWIIACRAGRHPDPSLVAKAEQAATQAEANAEQCLAAKLAPPSLVNTNGKSHAQLLLEYCFSSPSQ